MIAAIVVVIVVSAGILSFAYVDNISQHHLPVYSSNTVVNETVAGNFLTEGSLNASVYIFNATTSFLYHNISSNLNLKVEHFSMEYAETFGPPPYVLTMPFIIVTANITPHLRPTGLLVTISNYGPYNNSNVIGSQFRAGSFQPQSNTTPPNSDTFRQFAENFSMHAVFKLINQKTVNGMYSFGLFLEAEIDFIVFHPQNGIGTHILHIIASLQGLGVPITTTINVLLIDKS